MTRQMIYFLLITFLSVSCSHYPVDVEQALELSGDNRVELEKVLEHYKNDSQKYKAAQFLIKNMPGHQHEVSNLDSFHYKIFDEMKNNDISREDAMFLLRKKYTAQFFHRYDVEAIKAQYLINNIEWAFKVWREVPWGKKISFDHFCNEILPYRVGTEPLEEWREHYYRYFQPILDSLQHDDSPLTACQILYDALVKKNWKYTSRSYADLGAKILLQNNEGGHCETQTQLMTFVMRSVGIPGGIDSYLCAPDRMGGPHAWNYLRNSNGKIVPFEFEPCDMRLFRDTSGNLVDSDLDRAYPDRMTIPRKKGKVYRKDFDAYSKNIAPDPDNEEFPLSFQKMKELKDVSFEYFEKNNIRLDADIEQDKKILYLCVFNDKGWFAVDYMEIKNGKVRLNEIEPNVVFLPAFCGNQNFVPAGHPFIYDGKKIRYLIPDSSHLEKVILTRKYTISFTMERLRKYVVGGKFQVATHADFSDAQTIHEITKEADMMYNTVSLDMDKEYQFIRYLSADNGFCNMAELEFYSPANELLKGETIGTDGTRWGVEAHTKHAVFDKDPLTYYISKESSGAWVGLDFGEPERIGKIRYLFRNDDNSIRAGDRYELFYFTPQGWKSCGEKQGQEQEQYLVYDNVPVNALLLLRNYTRGREERIFTYQDGKQIFW